LLAQVAKDRNGVFAGIVANADKTTVEDLDQPIDSGVGLRRLARSEPIDHRPFNPWQRAGLWIDFRRVPEKNGDWVAHLVKEGVIRQKQRDWPRHR
jgi:hypothetical protein